MGRAVVGFNLHLQVARGGAADVQHGDGGVVEAEPAEPFHRKPEQLQHQATQDGVVGHHQHRFGSGSVETVQVVGQKPIGEAPGLVHQLQEGAIGPAVGALQFQRFGGLPPAPFLLRMVRQQILTPKAAPGRQVDLQQFLHVQRVVGGTVGLQQQGGRLAGPLQGRAVDGPERNVRQGAAGAARLFGPFLRQG